MRKFYVCSLLVLILFQNLRWAETLDTTISTPEFSIPTAADLTPESNWVVQWLTYFYLNPKPGKVGDVLKTLDELGWLNSANGSILGFLATLFKHYPGSYESALQKFQVLAIKSRLALIKAAWLQDPKNCSDIMHRFQSSLTEEERSMIQRLKAKSAQNLLRDEIDVPSKLDQLWGGFFVTGKQEYIRRLASVLDDYTEGNAYKDEQVIANASHWSLISNSIQHLQVYDHIVNLSKKCIQKEKCLNLWDIAARSTIERSRMSDDDLLRNDFPVKFEIHLEKSKSNKSSSLVTLAEDFLFGRGTKKDVTKSIELLERAHRLGNGTASLRLGELYKSGVGKKKDPRLAVSFFTTAAQRGSSLGKLQLAVCKFLGIGGEKAELQGVDLAREAADAGQVSAQQLLARIYTKDKIVKQDYDQAVYWLEKAAVAGSANAAFSLWKVLHARKPEKIDLAGAHHWLVRAASMGHPGALVLLRAETSKESPRWQSESRSAAETGDAESQFDLAMEYVRGNNREKDIGEAINWLRKAADQNHLMAMNNLAYLLSQRDEELEHALEVVDKVLKIEPDSHHTLDTKGWILYKMGKLAESLEYIKKACDLDPESESNDKGRHLRIIQEAIRMSNEEE